MTFGSIPQFLSSESSSSESLSHPTRALAGVAGAIFVVAFLELAVRHPVDGGWAALLCGVPMILLTQGARTGRAWNRTSLVWFAVWYAVFTAGWLVACALQQPAPGQELSPDVGLGVFLGSIVFVGGASSYARARDERERRTRARRFTG